MWRQASISLGSDATSGMVRHDLAPDGATALPAGCATNDASTELRIGRVVTAISVVADNPRRMACGLFGTTCRSEMFSCVEATGFLLAHNTIMQTIRSCRDVACRRCHEFRANRIGDRVTQDPIDFSLGS